MSKKPIFRVVFQNNNKQYELYVKAVYQSDMYGFIEIEEFVFGEVSGVIVDPTEEKLKNEFVDVKRSYIPLHNLIRIDEVDKEGVAKIRDVKPSDNVTKLPLGSKKDKKTD